MKKPFFVSYHVKDRRAGEWITEFFKHRSIPFTGLAEDLDQCDTFVALISQQYLSTPDTEELLRKALKGRKRLLLLIIDEYLTTKYGGLFGWLVGLAQRLARDDSWDKFQSIMREINLAGITCKCVNYEDLRASAAVDHWEYSRQNKEPLWLRLLNVLSNSPPNWDISLTPDGELYWIYQFVTEAAEQLPPSVEESAPADPAPAAGPEAEPKVEPESEPEIQPKQGGKRRIPALIRQSSGEIIELPEGMFYIGSDPLACGCCIEMPDVSDRHLSILTGPRASHVTDLSGSAGGMSSLINGESGFPAGYPLRHGDIITIGGEDLIFRYM